MHVLKPAVAWPGFVGLKLHPSFHRAFADDPAYERAWEFAAEHDLSILAHTWSVSHYNPAQHTPPPSGWKLMSAGFLLFGWFLATRAVVDRDAAKRSAWPMRMRTFFSTSPGTCTATGSLRRWRLPSRPTKSSTARIFLGWTPAPNSPGSAGRRRRPGEEKDIGRQRNEGIWIAVIDPCIESGPGNQREPGLSSLPMVGQLQLNANMKKPLLNIDLTGRIALVLGGSRGIGAGITECLCRAGATTTFTHTGKPKHQERIERLLAQVRQEGGKVEAVVCNALDSQATAAAAADIVQRTTASLTSSSPTWGRMRRSPLTKQPTNSGESISTPIQQRVLRGSRRFAAHAQAWIRANHAHRFVGRI